MVGACVVLTATGKQGFQQCPPPPPPLVGVESCVLARSGMHLMNKADRRCDGCTAPALFVCLFVVVARDLSVHPRLLFVFEAFFTRPSSNEKKCEYATPLLCSSLAHLHPVSSRLSTIFVSSSPRVHVFVRTTSKRCFHDLSLQLGRHC